MTTHDHHWRKLLTPWLEQVDAIALQLWRAPLQQHSKATYRDLVTEADLKVDELTRSMLQQLTPTYGLLSEEVSQQDDQVGDYQWVLDPIDGTVNFAMGSPLFGVSLGLLKHGQPLFGIISFPALEEVYWAQVGQGAWMQRKQEEPIRCQVSTTTSLRDARHSIGFGYSNASSKQLMQVLPDFLQQTAATRIHFCATFDFMNVARGTLDFYTALKLNLWDFAAAWCILNEAGGLLTTINADPLTTKSTRVIATNGLLTPVVKQLLQKSI